MTPYVPITNGAQVEIIFSLDGEPVENRLWFVSRQPPIDATQMQNLVDGVATWHVEQILPFLSHELLLGTVIGREWTGGSPGFPFLSIVNLVGGDPDGSSSANVADRIWFKSAYSTRYIRNSHFIPGVPRDKIDLNTVDSSWRSSIRDGYINLIDLAPVFGPFPAWRWMCASSWDAGSLRTTQLVLRTDLISYKRPWVAQRRKRLPAV